MKTATSERTSEQIERCSRATFLRQDIRRGRENCHHFKGDDPLK